MKKSLATKPEQSVALASGQKVDVTRIRKKKVLIRPGDEIVALDDGENSATPGRVSHLQEHFLDGVVCL